jgi:hypothetical protein
MVKYILKESELRSMIEGIVAEEVNNILNESLGSALGSALGNTLKYGALGVVAPTMLASKAFSKANGIVNGNDTILGTVKDYFGNGTGSSTASGRKTRGQRQNERLANGKNISYEYGKPELIPSWGSHVKLDDKREILPPPYDAAKKTGCMLPWGSFGLHYHDEGDRMWNRMITDKEKSILRVSGGDKSKEARLLKKYKRILNGWLKDRDKAYKIYIKENNRL